MSVVLSPVGGVAAQFFTNSGAVLTGGKIYTYAAGTSTPEPTYTTASGTIAWTNPIVLDAAGRVPDGGEIWLTDGVAYKFVLKTSNDVLIATYDNISGINSNFVNFTNDQEIQVATAGQTVFTLTTMAYLPGTHSLSVFVDGVNQYGPGASYAYEETDSTTVTFTSGLHVGAEVKFSTTQLQGAGAIDASQVSYDPPFTGSVATNVEAKLAQTVSVKDFGAVGDGGVDDYQAIQNAIDAVGHTGTILFPFQNRFLTSQPIQLKGANIVLEGSLGAHPTFHSATMSDGRTSAAIVYVSNPGGAGKGTSITGSINLSFFDIDASDPNGIARADHCIEYQNADNFVAQQLLLRRAIVSNVRISGQGYANNFKDVVSTESPYGWQYDITSPAGGATGNAHFDNCYATQCQTGYYLRNVFSVSMDACAGDSCDLALYAIANGRVSINGWNSEGSTSVFLSDAAYISVNNALITNTGTASTATANSYSGQTGAPVSPTGVEAMSVATGGVLELKGALFAGCDSTCEYMLLADQYSKFVELNNWANYNTNPKQGVIAKAIAVGGAAWAVSFAAGSYALDQDNFTTYTSGADANKTLVNTGIDIQANSHTSYSPTATPSVDFHILPGGTASSYTALALRTRGTTATETASAFAIGVSSGDGNADLAMGPSNNYTYRENLRLKHLGATRFYPLSAAPASAEEGDVYYDSSTHKLYCYNGSTWNALF